MAEVYGKYELLERIASGGMAEVYKARLIGAAGFSKYVAIKRLHQHLAEDEDMVRMLMDEARLVSMMNHPNVCQVIDFGYESDTYYIAMEFIDGRDMSSMIRRTKRQGHKVPLNIGLKIIQDVLSGLDYAHRLRDPDTGAPLNIIHRDVSPQNVMITWEGTVKVIDFGIAKAEQALHSTQAGVIKGKFRYMAPEQAMGLNLDHRVDIFAVGVMLYELILGESHARQMSDTQMLFKMQRAEFDPIDRLVPSTPPDLAAAVMKALAHNPAERYPSARTFRKALEKVVLANGLHADSEEVAAYLMQLFPGRQNTKSRVDLIESSTHDMDVGRLNTVNAVPKIPQSGAPLPPPPQYDYLTDPAAKAAHQQAAGPSAAPAPSQPQNMDIAALLAAPPPPEDAIPPSATAQPSAPASVSQQPVSSGPSHQSGTTQQVSSSPARPSLLKRTGRGLLKLADMVFSLALVLGSAYGVYYFVTHMQDDPGVIEKLKNRQDSGDYKEIKCMKEDLGTVVVQVRSRPKGASIFVNGQPLGVKTPAVFGLEMCKKAPTIFRAELDGKGVDLMVDKFPLSGELDLYFDLRGSDSKATERKRGSLKRSRTIHRYKYNSRKSRRRSTHGDGSSSGQTGTVIRFGSGQDSSGSGSAAGDDHEEVRKKEKNEEKEEASAARLLPKGDVVITCKDACKVYVNGRKVGGILDGSRRYRLVARSRPYVFRVEFLDGGMQKRTVVVKEGSTQRFTFKAPKLDKSEAIEED